MPFREARLEFLRDSLSRTLGLGVMSGTGAGDITRALESFIDFKIKMALDEIPTPEQVRSRENNASWEAYRKDLETRRDAALKKDD